MSVTTIQSGVPPATAFTPQGPYFGPFGRAFSTPIAAQELEFELYDDYLELRGDVDYLLSNSVVYGEEAVDISDICNPCLVKFSNVCHHGHLF